MRIRHKPYARSELAAWPNHINDPQAARGHWKEKFASPKLPLHLELGCGKGRFLATHALQEPNTNFLGIDLKSEVLVVSKRTIEKTFAAAGASPLNIAICPYDIERIREILAPEDTIERLYINFCNPWYKSGHAKHRLTHPRQLVQYRQFLRPTAELYFKTDDEPLFRDSLRYFSLSGFELIWKTHDLHLAEPRWNVRTEHEKMFSDEGIAIKACILKMGQAPLEESTLAALKII